MESRQLAGFIVSEVSRQMKKAAGNDFARVDSITDAGRAKLEVRPGKYIEVEPAGGKPAQGASINLNKGRGLYQADGNSLYS
jgi:hypothetical protein